MLNQYVLSCEASRHFWSCKKMYLFPMVPSCVESQAIPCPKKNMFSSTLHICISTHNCIGALSMHFYT